MERNPKDLILNIRKRLVKKSTIVEVESDSEGESFVSLDPTVPSSSADYTSADDGDVDSPIVSKVKSKSKEVAAPPMPFPVSNTQIPRPSDADNEKAFAPETTSRARGIAISLSSLQF